MSGGATVDGMLHPDVVPILRKILKEKIAAGECGHEIAVLDSAADRIERLHERAKSGDVYAQLAVAYSRMSGVRR